MSTVINFHNITHVAVDATREHRHDGAPFFARSITVTFEDGSAQRIALFSATAEAIEVNAETEPA